MPHRRPRRRPGSPDRRDPLWLVLRRPLGPELERGAPLPRPPPHRAAVRKWQRPRERPPRRDRAALAARLFLRSPVMLGAAAMEEGAEGACERRDDGDRPDLQEDVDDPRPRAD